MAEMITLAFRGIINGIQIYQILLVIYILMSWLPSSRDTKFGQILGRIAEPYLGFFRRFIPPLGMIDISPIVALFALGLISKGIIEVYNMIIWSSLM